MVPAFSTALLDPSCTNTRANPRILCLSLQPLLLLDSSRAISSSFPPSPFDHHHLLHLSSFEAQADYRPLCASGLLSCACSLHFNQPVYFSIFFLPLAHTRLFVIEIAPHHTACADNPDKDAHLTSLSAWSSQPRVIHQPASSCLPVTRHLLRIAHGPPIQIHHPPHSNQTALLTTHDIVTPILCPTAPRPHTYFQQLPLPAVAAGSKPTAIPPTARRRKK